MAKEKKNYNNFACKLDADIFERLDEYCRISGQTKTYVVERALSKYLDENFEKAKEFAKNL